MRRIYLVFIVCIVTIPGLIKANYATVELAIAQADWNAKTKELQFDVQLKAVDKPFYLAFSDLVIALPKAVVNLNQFSFNLIPGSTQLFNLGGDRLAFQGIRTRTKLTADSVLFIVQLMPNSFTAMTDFFEQSIHISKQAGESRIGRFSISGIVKAPELIRPFYAPKGPSTLLLAFEPKDQFKAVDLTVKAILSRPEATVLKAFECNETESEYLLDWKWKEKSTSWQLWWSVDRLNWTLLESGKGGQGLKFAKNNPAWANVAVKPSFRLTFSAHGANHTVVRLP